MLKGLLLQPFLLISINKIAKSLATQDINISNNKLWKTCGKRIIFSKNENKIAIGYYLSKKDIFKKTFVL